MPRSRALLPLLLTITLPLVAAPAAQAADRVSITELRGLTDRSETRVTALNDVDQIVGSSGGSPVLWSRGQVVALPGSTATAINRRGQVLLLDNRIGNGDYVQHPLVWHNGTTTGIAPEGSGVVTASAINASGSVPMTYSPSPAVWHPEQAALWLDGAVRPLSSGNSGSHLYSSVINDRGLVAGAFVPMMGGTSYAFRCQGTTCSRLPDPEGTAGSYSVAAANESGVVVGSRANSPVRWQGDTATVLPGGEGRVAGNQRAINERGDVVGRTKDGAGVHRATVWRAGRQVVIPVPGPAEAVAVNDRSDVVGWSKSTGETRAFLWRNGKVVDLGTLGGAYSSPTSLNDNGTIVGLATTADGAYRAVKWTVR
ncbi:hypothetical protein [Actinosynnema sp. NPDC023587]|uniref:hypothetical protein n=1 Tax=Actinosynnema sp. NPDC023587 TaxID=3154695 RepID=UPI0033DFA487